MTSAGATEVLLAEMHPDDLERVLAIERASFDRPWSRDSFVREFDLAFSRTLVARSAGVVVGYLCRWRLEDEIQILNVAVAPEARRRGVGRALVEAVLCEAGADRLDVSLEVAVGNDAALRLYEALGFTVAGARPDFYGRGRHARTMRRAAAGGSGRESP